MQQTAAKQLGEYIHYQREKRNITLNEFAGESGLTASFVSRLEQGDYQTVKFDVIQKLAHGLQMSVEDLLWKCELIERSEQPLPELEYYLKEKFQFPLAAIDDAQLFFQLLEKKYQHEIAEMKKAHDKYWKKKRS